MNKSQLVEAVAKATKQKKTVVADVLSTMFDTIKKTMKKGDDVAVAGFGVFSRAKRKARMGRNPATGKAIKIAARGVPKFRPGKELKEALK